MLRKIVTDYHSQTVSINLAFGGYPAERRNIEYYVLWKDNELMKSDGKSDTKHTVVDKASQNKSIHNTNEIFYNNERTTGLK